MALDEMAGDTPLACFEEIGPTPDCSLDAALAFAAPR